jgi:CheY-like chemotaxis protein
MDVLLVEDNLGDANIAIQALKRGRVPCRVSLVCDGEEAIGFLYRKGEFARAPTPDLVLLDRHLPGEEGRRVLAEIRANEELKDIPVVILAGPLDRRAGLRVQELHADGLMATPVALEKFIGTVKPSGRSCLSELALSSIA